MKLATTVTAIALAFPSIVRAIYLWPVPQSIQVGNTDLELDVSTLKIIDNMFSTDTIL